MNVLITIISLLNSKKLREYEVKLPNCDVQSVNAYQTNESVFKALIEIQEVKNSGGIHKIIALVSNKVLTEKKSEFKDPITDESLTTYEYYKSIVNEHSSQTKLERIEIENADNSSKSIPAILSEICNKINNDDIIYIDGAGGRRTTNNVIQLLLNLLKYKGIKTPYSIYSDINGNEAKIEDTADFVKMLDLLDAFNEFMTTGKSYMLSQCVESNTKSVSPQIVDLLNSMTIFSDKVQLGNLEKLDETVKELNKNIEVCSVLAEGETIESVILKQLLPVIKEKLIGNDESISYAKIIKWCLDNLLVQQALTIFVEKIPVYIFDQGIIVYHGDKNQVKQEHEDTRTKTTPSDWETFVFYGELLEEKKTKGIHHPLIKELIDNLSTHKSKNKKIQEITQELENLRSNWGNYTPKSAQGKRIKHNSNGKGLQNFNEYLEKIKKGDMDSVYIDMLGEQTQKNKEEKPNTTEKKLRTIKKIESGKWYNENFSFVGTPSEIASIFYGYIYVKAFRNQINHASSDENLNNSQKKLFETLGYSSSTNVLEVKKNISMALNTIEDVIKTRQEKKVIEEIQTITPTTLQIGDIVEAKCIDKKIVSIEGYNYNIQLIVSKAENTEELINKQLRVKVKQISKAGKIIQVDYLETIKSSFII